MARSSKYSDKEIAEMVRIAREIKRVSVVAKISPYQVRKCCDRVGFDWAAAIKKKPRVYFSRKHKELADMLRMPKQELMTLGDRAGYCANGIRTNLLNSGDIRLGSAMALLEVLGYEIQFVKKGIGNGVHAGIKDQAGDAPGRCAPDGSVPE